MSTPVPPSSSISQNYLIETPSSSNPPSRKILQPSDHKSFLTSKIYGDFLLFITDVGDGIKIYGAGDDYSILEVIDTADNAACAAKEEGEDEEEGVVDGITKINVTPKTSTHNNPYPSPAPFVILGVLHTLQQTLLSKHPPTPRGMSKNRRFGDLVFREWHAEFLNCLPWVLGLALTFQCEEKDVESFKRVCIQNGVDIATRCPWNDASSTAPVTTPEMEELIAHMTPTFGHPVRLDYGTGHECSFMVFIFCLIHRYISPHSSGNSTTENTSLFPSKSTNPKGYYNMILTLFKSYISLSRAINYTYILEPAGSHGVWGLDDYYCLGFYYGGCEMVFHNSVNGGSGAAGGWGEVPGCIRDLKLAADDDSSNISSKNKLQNNLLYISSILYIHKIKPTAKAPFAETSPMLNDISYLPTWTKLTQGLAKLFTGEVLGKFVVVQHFLFGGMFEEDWVPSESAEAGGAGQFGYDYGRKPILPKRDVLGVGNSGGVGGVGGVATRAPWADKQNVDGGVGAGVGVATKAPWADKPQQRGDGGVARAPWADKK